MPSSTEGAAAAEPAPPAGRAGPPAASVFVLASALVLVLTAGLLLAWARPGDPVDQAISAPGQPPAHGGEDVSAHVRRVAGPSRAATSAAVSREAFPDGAAHAVLASADAYPDALAGAALAGAWEGPLLLVGGDGLAAEVRDELAWLDPDRVTVVGGQQAVPTAVAEELTAGLGIGRVQRIHGNSRFETAAESARALADGDAGRAYLAAAADPGSDAWPDAVTVAALAAHEQAPVLLSATDALPEATAEAITDLGIGEVTVVGGSAAVSDAVVADLEDLGVTVGRAAGGDRYATSRAVVDLSAGVGLDATRPWLATGKAWPDALVAGVAAAAAGGPLILADGHDLDLSPATQRWLLDDPRPEHVTVVGGRDAVGDALIRDLTALASLAAGEGARVAAAGDIACYPGERRWQAPDWCRHADTATLAAEADRVLALGDLQYWEATLANFAASYDPSWGAFADRTHPTPGNHEYDVDGAADYFAYFGQRAGQPGRGYYEVDVGGWQVLSLNSNCAEHDGCRPGSAQLAWLAERLEASDAGCQLAFMHHPRYSGGATHGHHPQLLAMWEVLQAGGVDVVLAGHAHNYERFRRADAHGNADAAGGIRSFVVGTGGINLRPFDSPHPLSAARTDEHFGVLELELHDAGYTWQFRPANAEGFDSGRAFSDAGFGGCR